MVTPPLLVAMAWGSELVDAPVLLSLALAGLAALLGYVALFDYARSIEIGETGVDRICILRRQHTPWDDIAVIARPRGRGLVLVTTSGKSRILLDRRLEGDELELFRAQLHRLDIDSDL
ncbi:MAG: hypothetical protein WCA93_01480 [Acidimicrobiia bacterium]